MKTKMKPCPFCGGYQTETLVSPTNSKKKYVRCSNGECPYGAWSRKEDRDFGWNHRPIEDALQARIAELEKDYAALLKSNSDRFSVQIKNACENSLVLKKCIDECNLLRKDKAELETQLADLRANSRTKIELDTCRSLNDSLRDENVRLIAENKKLKGGSDA